MSGIAAVVALDAAPVDPELLGRMAERLARRGPDGRQTRALGGCGLVHALLLTGDEAAPAPQPFSLDGQAWITADARIDGRDALARALRGAGEAAACADETAAALILRAYRAWGTACVERLLGDFAFALWDAPRRRLFCARDPLGVKPFYYAAASGAFVVSNTLECVRLHPGVDDALDDAAVADFLVHSFIRDSGRTIRRGVRALPAAHRLVLQDGRHAVERYWELPRDEPLRHRGPAECAEHFVEVLREAVRDRVPAAGASILLSGGRDSPTVAALAREGAPTARLHGFTARYDRLIHDDEPRYAALASRALGISIDWLAVDGYRPFARFESDPLLARPEPVDAPLLAIEVDQLRGAAARGRVLLTGTGGDPVLRETASRLTRLVAGGRLLRAGAEAAQYAWWHRRVPRPGVRTWVSGAHRRPLEAAEAPPWISPELARRVDLAARIAEQNAPAAAPHPLRPEAAAQLASCFWPTLFGDYDPGVTGLPVEVRHPFFDLRVVRFALAVPPAQWYNDKGLLRIGMRGRLPAPLLRRPKTPLREDPLDAHRRAEGDAWLDGRTLGAEVAPWVAVERVPRAAGGRGEDLAGPVWPHLRPLGLALWLRRQQW
ncbi:MAG TPA: asparagine synthase-related protein [Longimicrobium sp.]|nr:asparagine synthase-related protein [Longimicrobium sp.]